MVPRQECRRDALGKYLQSSSHPIVFADVFHLDAGDLTSGGNGALKAPLIASAAAHRNREMTDDLHASPPAAVADWNHVPIHGCLRWLCDRVSGQDRQNLSPPGPGEHPRNEGRLL